MILMYFSLERRKEEEEERERREKNIYPSWEPTTNLARTFAVRFLSEIN